MQTTLCHVSLLLALAGSGSNGEGWPNWRGPNFDGSVEAKGLPSTWSESENVVWKTELPGQGAATPVVAGGKVFLTALGELDEELVALCVDRASGEVLWDRVVGKGRMPSGRSRGRENTMAACSPVADAERAYFLFGTGQLLAFDHDGEELWSRDLVAEHGRMAINWGYASSPLLFEGTLYVQVLHSGESYFMGIDPASGETRWRHVRANEANRESQEAYTTPMPFDNGGKTEILVLGADCLTGHDPESGEELWRWCGNNPRNRPNFRTVSNPVATGDGRVVVTSPQHNAMRGLQVRGTSVEEVWTFDKPTPDSSTPLSYRGRLFAVDGRNQRMICLEPKTGKLVWQAELPTETFLRTSPTGADGKIYVVGAEGTVIVVEASDEFRQLARVPMDSYPSRSSVVVDSDQLLIRTAENLYCIGSPR